MRTSWSLGPFFSDSAMTLELRFFAISFQTSFIFFYLCSNGLSAHHWPLHFHENHSVIQVDLVGLRIIVPALPSFIRVVGNLKSFNGVLFILHLVQTYYFSEQVFMWSAFLGALLLVYFPDRLDSCAATSSTSSTVTTTTSSSDSGTTTTVSGQTTTTTTTTTALG